MSQQLLGDAFDQAQHAGPDVRAAAYLHIARVLYRFDPAQALSLVDQAIAIVETLGGDLRIPMQRAAIALAATVAPATALRLVSTWQVEDRYGASIVTMALFNMMSHGHRAEAVAFLCAPLEGVAYPFDAAMNAIGPETSDEDRVRLLRGAITALRKQAESAPVVDPLQMAHGFAHLFTRHWRILPEREARDVVREIAQWILDAPDRRMTSGFGGGDDQPRFSSTRQHALYQFLSPLQHLDPDLTRALVADHSELAKAAARYPYGMDSVIEELEARAASAPPPSPSERAWSPDAFVYLGHQAIPVAEAISTKFRSAFDRARDLYAADIAVDAPNEAPRECWPSTYEFRSILHAAGEVQGPEAVPLLDEVPAGDSRLLASIELAAALAGLPALGGSMIPPRPKHSRAPQPTLPPDLPFGRMPKPREPLPPARKPRRAASVDLHVAPSSKGPGERPSGGCGSDFWVIEGVRLAPVIARLFDVPETRVELPTSLPPGRFDFVLVMPADATQETMTRLMRTGIERHFGIVIERDTRRVDALVLSAPEGIRAKPVETSGGGFFAGGFSTGSISWVSDTADDDDDSHAFDLDAIFDMQMAKRELPLDHEGYMLETMKRFARLGAGQHRRGVLTGIAQEMTMSALCELLESSLRKPVVDETGLAGTYVLKVETAAKTTADFLAALRTQTGLDVTAALREVPMVVALPVT